MNGAKNAYSEAEVNGGNTKVGKRAEKNFLKLFLLLWL